MEPVKDHEFYKGLAKAIETYMKYGSPGHNDPFVLRMSHSCAEALLRLLKEQEPVFVGCSDCKHYGYHDMTNQDGFCYCMKRHEYLSPDFFCADWEGGGNN